MSIKDINEVTGKEKWIARIWSWLTILLSILLLVSVFAGWFSFEGKILLVLSAMGSFAAWFTVENTKQITGE